MDLAMDQRLKIGDLVNSLHIYPTYSMASQQAALHIRMAQMLTGSSGRMILDLDRLGFGAESYPSYLETYRSTACVPLPVFHHPSGIYRYSDL
jgi:hypothetical protein